MLHACRIRRSLGQLLLKWLFQNRREELPACLQHGRGARISPTSQEIQLRRACGRSRFGSESSRFSRHVFLQIRRLDLRQRESPQVVGEYRRSFLLEGFLGQPGFARLVSDGLFRRQGGRVLLEGSCYSEPLRRVEISMPRVKGS